VRAAPAGRSDRLSAALAAFLASPRINQRTDDDKTLILATRRGPVGAGQAPGGVSPPQRQADHAEAPHPGSPSSVGQAEPLRSISPLNSCRAEPRRSISRSAPRSHADPQQGVSQFSPRCHSEPQRSISRSAPRCHAEPQRHPKGTRSPDAPGDASLRLSMTTRGRRGFSSLPDAEPSLTPDPWPLTPSNDACSG
jgi:hypothetical protein